MSFTFSHRNNTGKTIYASIQDMLNDGKYWDADAGNWVSTVNDNCYVALTESGSSGAYSATDSNLTLLYGGIFRMAISEYADSEYSEICHSTYHAPTSTSSLLSLVNDVQRSCRFSATSTVTDSFSLSVIRRANDVLRTLLAPMKDAAILTVQGGVYTVAGTNHYLLSPSNISDSKAAVIRLLKGPNGELAQLTDKQFSDMLYNVNITAAASRGIPQYFTVVGERFGLPVVKVYPTPDDEYELQYSLSMVPGELSGANDYVHFYDTVRLGATAMVKADLGRDVTADAILFEDAKYNLACEHGSNSSAVREVDA